MPLYRAVHFMSSDKSQKNTLLSPGFPHRLITPLLPPAGEECGCPPSLCVESMG